jgi:PAS domain S-box-containing protein
MDPLKLQINHEFPVPMLMVKEDGKIHIANEACCELFGYEKKDFVGQNLSILLPEKIRARHAEYVKQFFALPRCRKLGTARDLYGVKKDGGVIPLEIGLYPLGEYTMALVVDITTGRKYAMSSV